MNFLNNRTWFLLPVNFAVVFLLIWGYSETVVKVGSPLAILQFALAVLMCLCFTVYIYYKLKRITLESAENQLKAMRGE